MTDANDDPIAQLLDLQEILCLLGIKIANR